MKVQMRNYHFYQQIVSKVSLKNKKGKPVKFVPVVLSKFPFTDYKVIR